MSKWKQPAIASKVPSLPMESAPEPRTNAPHLLPPGKWMKVQRETDHNGARGWALYVLVQTPDGFEEKRIHGPDLFEVTSFKLQREVAD